MPDATPYAVSFADHGDLEGILDVFTAVAGEGRWIATEIPIDRAERHRRFGASIDDAQAVVLVARGAGTVVGHLALIPERPGLLQLGMTVAAAWRGSGIGSALLGRGVADARSRGAYKICLQVFPHNAAARALYRRHGFVEEGYFHRHLRRANGERWDSIPMALLLD